MITALLAAQVFLCADYPDRPLFIADYDKCTNVLLSTVAVPNRDRPTVRDVTVRIEAGVPKSRDRYRLSDVRMRVNCADLSAALVSSTEFNRAGTAVRRQQPKAPVKMPKLTDPLQVKALRAVCRKPLP